MEDIDKPVAQFITCFNESNTKLDSTLACMIGDEIRKTFAKYNNDPNIQSNRDIYPETIEEFALNEKITDKLSLTMNSKKEFSKSENQES